MANKRMFSKEITESDWFVDMPLSSQALYFHLGMGADDDGFVSPQRVLRTINANKNDLDILVSKKFCIAFEDGVVVITHWKTNNYLRGDTYKPTLYQQDFLKLGLHNGVYAVHGPSTDSPLECDIDKVDKVDKIRQEKISLSDFVLAWNAVDKINHSINKGLPKCMVITEDIKKWRDKLCKELTEEQIYDSVQKYIDKLEKDKVKEGRDCKHRFSLGEFIKQSNGARKYINS